MTLVAKQAPDFTAAAVLASGEMITNFNLYKFIKNKYAVLFFYPLDFTFVCPSELIALNNKISKFTENDVEIIAISVDSHYTHNAWRNTPISSGGIDKIDFTLVSDLNHKIAQSYGIEHPELGVALRATFILDKHKIVKSQTINDLTIGRNIDELIRTIDAIQYHEKYGEVCPAGWNKGKKAMLPTIEGVASYLDKHAKDL